MSEESRKYQSDTLNEAVPDVREDRIDWERKQKGKRRPEDVDEKLEDDTMSGVELVVNGNGNGRKKRKDARKKKRHLVLDEKTGRMVVKRRRRPHRDGHDFNDLEDEWEH